MSHNYAGFMAGFSHASVICDGDVMDSMKSSKFRETSKIMHVFLQRNPSNKPIKEPISNGAAV
jgi:hypothetical protein